MPLVWKVESFNQKLHTCIRLVNSISDISSLDGCWIKDTVLLIIYKNYLLTNAQFHIVYRLCAII